MNAGIELLLKRMETHPEDFWPLYNSDIHTKARFYDLVTNIMGWNNGLQNTPYLSSTYDFLDPEDIKAFKDGINKLRGEDFSANIFKQIVGGEEDPKEQSPSVQVSGMPSVGSTLGQLSSMGAGGLSGAGAGAGYTTSSMHAQNAYNHYQGQQSQALNSQSAWQSFKEFITP